MSIDQIMYSMVESEEHKQLVRAPSQVDSLQTTLASVNQQVIILQETLQEREKEIADLKSRTNHLPVTTDEPSSSKSDPTLTIFQALFNLYKFVFMPGKVS